MRALEWMLKVKVLLQLFNKSKLRNGTKTFLERQFFSIFVKFKKLGFRAHLKRFILCANVECYRYCICTLALKMMSFRQSKNIIVF